MKPRYSSLVWRAAVAAFVVAPKRTASAIILLALVGVGAAAMLSKAFGRGETFCNVQRNPDPPSGLIEWSYSFLDPDIDRLSEVRRDLEAKGFRFRCYTWGPCSDCPLRQLTMVRTESHDAESQRVREAEMCSVAKAHALDTYWVMRAATSVTCWRTIDVDR